MTAFVAAALLLTALAVGAVLLGPRLRRRQPGDIARESSNAAVLGQQLAELERERSRGLLGQAEFARLREELQRRLLAEAAPAESARGAGRPARALLACAAALPVAAALLYLQFGQPQLIGASPAQGPLALDGGAGSSAESLLARLEAHLAASPEDARGWVMLGRLRMQRDRFEPAAQAYERALAVSAKVARDPLIWCEYADAVGMAQGGRLAGRPRELIDRALALDAAHPCALEMAGSAAWEAGDFDGASRFWQRLLALLPAESREHAELAAAVARAQQRARFSLPAS